MTAQSVYDFKVRDIAGNEMDLSVFRGKVMLIVNTASHCGLAPQFKGLEMLYEEFKDEGFIVLGFPSNQFQGQEPLDGKALESHCQINYGVRFPIFEKTKVKGPDAAPLFRYFSDKKLNGKIASVPKWNFHKFLVDRKGRVVDYFFPITKPTSSKIKRKIQRLLAEESN